jgi:hypothetical protein
MQLHNTFTDAGRFTKTFSTANLPTGVYYLKILIGKDLKVKKYQHKIIEK